MVEHPICNRKVAGSSPIAGSRDGSLERGQVRGGFSELGQVAEWLMAADCKSAALRATEVRILPCPPIRRSEIVKRKTSNVKRSMCRVPSYVLRFTFYGGTGGSNSGVESQPSKLLVAGSIPVSRSNGQRLEGDRSGSLRRRALPT